MRQRKYNLKGIMLVVGIVAIAVIAGLIIQFKTNESRDKSDSLTLKKYEIANISESDAILPEFSIDIEGIYSGSIPSSSFAEYEIKSYDFDAGIDIGWKISTNKYTGAKLEDFLTKSFLENYSSITFYSTTGKSATYNKEDISDKVYLVYYKDDKLIGESSQPTLLVVDKPYFSYSLESISKMKLEREE